MMGDDGAVEDQTTPSPWRAGPDGDTGSGQRWAVPGSAEAQPDAHRGPSDAPVVGDVAGPEFERLGVDPLVQHLVDGDLGDPDRPDDLTGLRRFLGIELRRGWLGRRGADLLVGLPIRA